MTIENIPGLGILTWGCPKTSLIVMKITFLKFEPLTRNTLGDIVD